MPFNRDTRTCWCNVEFNEAFIYECLSDLEEDKVWALDKEFTEYVRELEDTFTVALSKDRKIDFNDWFIENYYNVIAFNHLHYEIEEEEEDDSVKAHKLIEEIITMKRKDMLIRCETNGFKKSSNGVSNKWVLAKSIFRGTMGRKETDEEDTHLSKVWGWD